MNTLKRCIAYTAIVSGCLAVLINLASSAYNIYRLSSSKEPEDVEKTGTTRMKRSIRMNFAKDVERDVEVLAEYN